MRVQKSFASPQVLALSLTLAGLAGCGVEPKVKELKGGPAGEDFAGGSGGSSPGPGGVLGGSGGSVVTGPPGKKPAPPGLPVEAPLRILQEADILKLQGERLYALSRHSGLSVVDVSNPDQLQVLGHHPMYGEPFEMYVEGGRVIVMSQRAPNLACPGKSLCLPTFGARVEILDASAPDAISSRGGVSLPGDVTDSRLVNGVLYVASHEAGDCKDCGGKPRTTLSSLSVDHGSLALLDRKAFSSETAAGSRSLLFQGGRFFLAGGEAVRSRVQVVDASDPGGKLALGASFEVHGRVESRWQMDVHKNVLRVISQPSFIEDPPLVETFQVQSSSVVTPLAQVPFALPPGERLRTVRFDGDRAFAITVRETDPLFTFDLSDPTAPKQRGELVIPGWVYHIEPRGDRLLALGFDNLSDVGPLNVSLFDVGNLDKPVLLDREHFAKVGTFVEDRDRIHKAFHIAEKDGLLMVPFAGSFLGSDGCAFESGIQLLDFDKNSITRRGVVPEHGQAKRAFLKGERLLALAEDKLRTFDISDRDKPAETSEVALAKKIAQSLATNGRVAQLGADWWSGAPRMDVVPIQSPELLDTKATMEASGVLPVYAQCEDSSFPQGLELLPRGDAMVAYWPVASSTNLAVFSVAKGGPELLGEVALPFPSASALPGLSKAVLGLGEPVATQAGRWLVFRENEATGKKPQRLHFVDLIDPTSPKEGPVLELPGGPLLSPLLFAGNILYTSRQDAFSAGPEEATFILDRIDLSKPDQPTKMPEIQIPGLLLHLAPDGSRALTVGFRQETSTVGPWEGCAALKSEENTGLWGIKTHWLYGDVCTWVLRDLQLVSLKGTPTVVDTLPMEDKERTVAGVAPGDARVLVLQHPHKKAAVASRVLLVGVSPEGKLTVKSETLPGGDPVAPLQIVESREDRAILHSSSQPATLLISGPLSSGRFSLDTHLLRGTPSHLFLDRSHLLASLGERGLQHIPLP